MTTLQKIIDGIPDTEDEVELAKYLAKADTIKAAASLSQADLLILEARLKQTYKAMMVNKWLRSIKKKKRTQSKQKQAAVPSHIQIADSYLSVMGNETMFARSDWHRYETGVWEVLPEIFFEKEMSQMLTNLESNHATKFTKYDMRSISAFIAAKCAVRDEDLDADDSKINMENGTFDIESQLLTPHEPEDYQTTQLPFSYDDIADCPNWIEYLKSTFVKRKDEKSKWEPDNELIDFIQEATGYSLTSSVEHQIMFWCIGKGANGKGVFFHILQALAGTAAMPLDIGGIRANNTYQLAMLAGKKIAYSTEAERNADMVSDGIVKSLVSGDPIMVRQIREKPFKLISKAKLWWSMNRLPKVNDTSHGFWRRVKVVPFNRIFTGDDIIPDLKEGLEDELPGIFNWAMRGWMRVLRNGRFTQPNQVTRLTEDYRKQSNPVELFIEEQAIKVDPADESIHTTITDTYSAYKAWCHEGNYRPLSRKNFKVEMEELGYYTKKKAAGICFMGVEIPENGPFTLKI